MIPIRFPWNSPEQGRVKSWAEMTREERLICTLDPCDPDPVKRSAYWAIEDASAREGIRRAREQALRSVAWEIAEGLLGFPAPSKAKQVKGRFTDADLEFIDGHVIEFKSYILRTSALKAREAGETAIAVELEGLAADVERERQERSASGGS